MTVSLESRLTEYAKTTGVKKFTELDEVMLDGLNCEAITSFDVLSKCDKLAMLTMNHSNLKSLPVFPADCKIKFLELAANKIAGGLESLANLTDLVDLNLGGNQIASIADLECLAKLPNLEVITLEECPITQTEGYRKAVFKAIPSLKVVDLEDAEGNVVTVSDDEDEFEDGDSDDLDSEDDSEGDSEDDSDDKDSDDVDSDEDSEEESEEDESEEAEPTKKTRRE